MANKKNKTKHGHKHAPQFSPLELLKQAEEQLRQGQTEQALQILRRAENDLRPRTGPDGKKAPLPSHLIPAQSKLPGVMAGALAANSLKLADPQQKLSALENAVKYAPAESRYLLALGAQQLLLGQTEAAFATFQKAHEISPGDKLATRAIALGLLANGRAREAGDLLKSNPTETRDEPCRRLSVISDWLSGSEPNFNQTLSQPLLSGLRHLAQNENDQAKTDLATLPPIDHNPTRTEAALLATQFFYSGVSGFQANSYREALADWREASRLTKSHNLKLGWNDRLIVYYHRLAERTSAGDLPLAVECWQEILAIAPADKIAANNLMIARRATAQQAWRDGRAEQAATIWHELLQLKPADENLLQSAALACEKLNRKSEALNHWRALARVWRQQLKQRAGESGFKDKLDNLQKRILELMHESGVTPEQELNELEAALRLDPDDQALLLRSAEVLLEMGKPQKALKHLNHIEQKYGATAILLTHKANAIDISGNTKSAQQTFKQAVEMEPENRLPKLAYLSFLGREADDAFEDEKTDLAIEFSEEQLRIDPNHVTALTRLAAINFELGHQPEAKQFLKRSIAIAPDKPQPYVMAGGIYWKFGLKKEAKEVFAKALKLDSSAECHFQIGLAYLMSCAHKEAAKCFDLAAKTAPFELVLEMGLEMFEHGEKKDARRFMNQAKKLNPTDPMPYFINAMIVVGRNPLELMLASDKDRKSALAELAEAERLMTGNREFDSIRKELSLLKQALETTPSGLLDALGNLGGGLPPFLLDDEPDFFPPAPKRKKKR